MGSITAATSFCFSRRSGMPISMVAAARSRTLEAEWTTKGMTNFTHCTAAPPIWAGACSNSLKHKCYWIMVLYPTFQGFWIMNYQLKIQTYPANPNTKYFPSGCLQVFISSDVQIYVHLYSKKSLQLQQESHLCLSYYLTLMYVSAFIAESYIINIDCFTSWQRSEPRVPWQQTGHPLCSIHCPVCPVWMAPDPM